MRMRDLLYVRLLSIDSTVATPDGRVIQHVRCKFTKSKMEYVLFVLSIMCRVASCHCRYCVISVKLNLKNNTCSFLNIFTNYTCNYFTNYTCNYSECVCLIVGSEIQVAH